VAFFKKELTVLAADVTGGPLTDFPLLVSITDADLQQNARPDGFDIFFTESDGTVLSYQRESYTSSTGKLIAWVLVDLSDTTDNIFFMFYGDPNSTDQQKPLSVWDTRFQDVFLFNETSFPWFNSSLGADITLTITLDAPVSGGGQIDRSSITTTRGTTEENPGKRGRMPTHADASPTDFFASAWLKYDDNSLITYNSWASNRPASGSETVIVFQSSNTNVNLRIIDDTVTLLLFGDMSDLQYHHIAIRYDSVNMDLFFDGSFVSSNPYTFVNPINFNAQQIGGGTDATSPKTGRIDQLQVAYTANFSNGFIKTSFDNQETTGQGAGNFVKVGVQQDNFLNNYLLLSQGAINEKESSSIINAICGDSSLKIGDTVRLLPLGTGEGFTQADDLLPRVGLVNENEVGSSSYGIVVGGDFEGVYSADPNADILSVGLVASFFGDGVRICTQGKCLAFADGTITGIINIGDGLTSTDSGLVPALGTHRVIARALQSTSIANSIIAVDVQREGITKTIPAGDLMLYQDFDIMEYQDFIDMDYEN